jgi:hypothetical protein
MSIQSVFKINMSKKLKYMQTRILHIGMSQRYFLTLIQPQIYRNKRGPGAPISSFIFGTIEIHINSKVKPV